MNHTKIYMLFILVLALVLAACGGGEEPVVENEGSEVETTSEEISSEDSNSEETAVSLTHKQMPLENARAGFIQARDFVATADPYDLENVSQAMMAIGESVTLNGKAGPFLGTLRRAITGQKVSPPLFESMVALGRERTLQRLNAIVALFD